MSRVVLLHGKPQEARVWAERLRRYGHAVELVKREGGSRLRALRDRPPEAFVIDLSRGPSQGCAVAVWLRRQKATRRVPIVFAEGEPAKVARVRRLLPDATYTGWSRIGTALREALRRPLEDPVVPGTMEAYAGVPLPKKLGIRSESVVRLLGAPEGFEKTLGAVPKGAQLQGSTRGSADIIVLFVKSRAELERRFAAATAEMAEGGRLWIAWPKGTSRLAADLTQQAVRAFGLSMRFVDYKIAAIDETWSGLCFARRGLRRGSGTS